MLCIILQEISMTFNGVGSTVYAGLVCSPCGYPVYLSILSLDGSIATLHVKSSHKQRWAFSIAFFTAELK